ncbi:MAG: hypothetical protein V3R81_15415 [Gammaproteobacteria bacterium]
MALITIVNPLYTSKFSVALTDKKSVWAKRNLRSPSRALTYVAQLQALGHCEAFAEAVTDLVKKAGAVEAN